MDKLVVLCLCFYSVLASIKIKELKVPESIESGTVDDIILDCDYEADESDIEIKWYFNDPNPIYQWIPGLSQPQAIGKLKNKIDVKYKITNDVKTMHRALHIIDITPDMSGNYTCKVSGLMSEAVDTKGMIIYEPADEELDLSLFENESEVVCEAVGVYPKPTMTIYIRNSNGSTIQTSDDDDSDVQFENHLYNISSTLKYDPDNVSNPFDYMCELVIPGTSYSIQKTKTHYLEPIEIQLEEDYVNSSTTHMAYNFTEGSSAFKIQPNQWVFSTVLLAFLMSILRF